MVDQSGSLAVRWHQEDVVTSFQSSRPAVDENHVYVGGLGESFYALSRADGRVVWSHDRDGSMSDSSPCCCDGTVYVGSGGGSVYAFDADDGTVEWRRTGPSAITSSPLVRDGVVYVGRNDGILRALDADDGSVLYDVDVGSPILSDVAYSNARNHVYVSTADVGVSAHDATDGRRVWARKFGTDVGSSTPVVDDDRGHLYFAANEVRALATADGTVAWGTSFFGASAGSSPVFDAEGVYVGGGNGTVYRIPFGERLLVNSAAWEFQTWDIAIASDLALAGNRLVVGSLDGTLYVLDTDSGTEIGSVSLPCEIRAAPVVRDDEVYLAGHDDGLYAFELPSEE